MGALSKGKSLLEVSRDAAEDTTNPFPRMKDTSPGRSRRARLPLLPTPEHRHARRLYPVRELLEKYTASHVPPLKSIHGVIQLFNDSCFISNPPLSISEFPATPFGVLIVQIFWTLNNLRALLQPPELEAH